MSATISPGRILDVGCGDKKATGAVGIDCRVLDGVDLVHDLDQTPWPLPDSSFDLILCSHVIEHTADIPAFLREVHRVGAPGARVRIETPHFSSLDSWTDPSHRHHLSLRSFNFFTEDGYLHQGRIFRVERVGLTFRRSALGSRLAAFFYRRSRYSYERNLAFALPAMNIEAELVVVK